MFFPLRFWIVVGDLALGPHRKRREQHPIVPLTDAECAEVAGPILSRPFAADQARIDAYQEAASIAGAMRMGPTPTLDESRAILQDKDLVPDTKRFLIFNRSLNHCEALIGRLDPLLKGPDWQYPVRKDEETELSELKAFKRLNYMLMAKARCRWLDGDEDGALTAIRQSIRFSERIQGCSGLFLHFLVGQSCKATLLRMFRATSLSNPPSERFFNELDSVSGGVGDWIPPWKQIFEDEFCFAVVPSAQMRGLPWEAKRSPDVDSNLILAYEVQQILVEWSVSNHTAPLDRIASLQQIRHLFEDMLPGFIDPVRTYERPAKLAADIAGAYPAWLSTMFFDPHAAPSIREAWMAPASLKDRQNPLGLLYLGRLSSVAAQMVLGATRLQAEARAIRTCLAALRHGAAVGASQQYQSLHQLVDAGFLTSIPTDPLWGGEVGFDANRQVIWCPGPKMFDLEKALDSRRSSDSWVWPLNRLAV